MAGKVLQIEDFITEDNLASEIAKYWVSWNQMRQTKKAEWEEVRNFVFATDTTKTANKTLPWKNTTTLPKLCQIRDNLFANYKKTLFPNRHWIEWEAADKSSNEKELRDNVENYMTAVVRRSNFMETMTKCIYDFIDYGNAFATVEWEDSRVEDENGKRQRGYVGPKVVRISPIDIVFNPIGDTFEKAPKVVQYLLSVGELKEYLEQLSHDENKDAMEEIFRYAMDLRQNIRQTVHGQELHSKDEQFSMDGFSSFQAYLESDMIELLVFHGDLYDKEHSELYRNHVCIVMDRHKVIELRPNKSNFSEPPIYHVGWRERQDNLWAMGPLDNLVGLQYRIDHLENMKADLMDLTTLPPLKIKGYVDDFEWGPMERIYTGDDGDVEIMSPDVQALQVNLEIAQLEQKMEEMAGAPKEALGFRTPGEKTKYEVQRLENAAGRVFQSKIELFETLVEKILNAMFEMCVRLMPPMDVGVYNDKLNITTFRQLSTLDITGNGMIRPVAAKHFAEKAERIQNITGFFSSAPGQDPSINVHFSGTKLASMFEELLEIEQFEIVQPFVRISEQAEAQKLANTQTEDVLMESQQSAGISANDASRAVTQGARPNATRRSSPTQNRPAQTPTPGPQRSVAQGNNGQAVPRPQGRPQQRNVPQGQR